MTHELSFLNSYQAAAQARLEAIAGRSLTESEIAKLNIKYQRAMRVYELFTTVMKNAHEMMMSVIRNLRIA